MIDRRAVTMAMPGSNVLRLAIVWRFFVSVSDLFPRIFTEQVSVVWHACKY